MKAKRSTRVRSPRTQKGKVRSFYFLPAKWAVFNDSMNPDKLLML